MLDDRERLVLGQLTYFRKYEAPCEHGLCGTRYEAAPVANLTLVRHVRRAEMTLITATVEIEPIPARDGRHPRVGSLLQHRRRGAKGRGPVTRFPASVPVGQILSVAVDGAYVYAADPGGVLRLSRTGGTWETIVRDVTTTGTRVALVEGHVLWVTAGGVFALERCIRGIV
jgi:hypothetical protein